MTREWRLLVFAATVLLLTALFARSGPLLAVALPYFALCLRPLWDALPSP